MNELLIGMLKNLLPKNGDYRIQFESVEEKTIKRTRIAITDNTTQKQSAFVDIQLPK